MIYFIIAFAAIVLIYSEYKDYKDSPKCKWCKGRHKGRCIFNPRAGRFFANTNDGHFDYDDPNK